MGTVHWERPHFCFLSKFQAYAIPHQTSHEPFNAQDNNRFIIF